MVDRLRDTDTLSLPPAIKSWRPLTTLTYRWNYAAHTLEPRGYHAANVALHALACALVLSLARAIFAPPPPPHGRPMAKAPPAESERALRERCARRADAELAALTCALAFAVHPVHTEAVASIVGRAELLCCLCFLLALLAHRRACRRGAGACGSMVPSRG